MARYAASARTAGAGSATLPIFSLYAVTGPPAVGCSLRTVKVTNTTSTAVALQLVRLSTTGTQGATVTASQYDPNSAPASCTAKQTHTVAPTITTVLASYDLGAAVGSAVFDAFGDVGLRIAAGSGNGIGLVVATGTGQICDVAFEWDE